MRAFPLGAALALLAVSPALAQRGVMPPAGAPSPGAFRSGVPAVPFRPFGPPLNPQFVLAPNPYPAIFPTATDFASSPYFYGGYADEYYRRYPPQILFVEPPPPPPPPDPATDPSRAKITLTVPETAEVFVEGQKLIQNGKTRTVLSPPLEDGRRYRYSIVVRWRDKDRFAEHRMEMPVFAGDRPVVMVLNPLSGK